MSEPGETVCEITKVSPFYGYRNKENSVKKFLGIVSKQEMLFFQNWRHYEH